MIKMELTQEIKKSIDKCVLCWLATVSNDLIPNVSPKEVFNYIGANKIIIANIASPQSVNNIKQQNNVCVSFVDVLVQKGFQIKGNARIVQVGDSGFLEMEQALLKMTKGMFPFSSITEITIDTVKPILAPRYILFPDTTESSQIESAKKSYGF